MTTLFKPLLACDYDPDRLRLPVWASYKLDGIRAIVRQGVVYSRSNKPIPNRYVQEKFKHLEHFDGELIVGDPTDEMCYRNTTSVVMSQEKAANDVQFFAFDHVERLGDEYRARLDRLYDTDEAVRLVQQQLIRNLDELAAHEATALEAGYEGLILRDPAGIYKMGRSTVNEGILLKVKQFCDFECEIIGFEERERNDNPATISELGRTKRSSHKAGKVGRGDLGALLLRTADGVEFACGTGFTDDERAAIWAARPAHLGKLAKIKAFPVGGYDAPRHPVFLGLRDRDDT